VGCDSVVVSFWQLYECKNEKEVIFSALFQVGFAVQKRWIFLRWSFSLSTVNKDE